METCSRCGAPDATLVWWYNKRGSACATLCENCRVQVLLGRATVEVSYDDTEAGAGGLPTVRSSASSAEEGAVPEVRRGRGGSGRGTHSDQGAEQEVSADE